MTTTRRQAVAGGLALGTAFVVPAPAQVQSGSRSMYGLIGKMTAQPGQRDALAAILLESLVGMPGCLSYVVAEDGQDADALWITEVWDSQASHQGSLGLPQVRDAISRARPLIAGFSDRHETRPIGGVGLQSPDWAGS